MTNILSTVGAKALAPKVQAEAGPATGQLVRALVVEQDLRALGIDATPAEITRAADVSARVVTLTADTTISAATHEGKTLLLGEVGGDAALAVTLPAASGSGAVYKFVVSVVNTSGYTIVASTNSGAFYGLITQVDKDSTAATGYHAAGGTGADVITLNGTTTGGLVGDTIVVEDIATNKWAVRGWCGVPAGSSIATPFS